MQMNTDASAVRINTNPSQLRRELARWPRAAQIGEREQFDATRYLRDLPSDAAKRIAAAEKLKADHLAAAEDDRQRYEAIRTQGLDALSNYDLVIAFGCDGLAALRFSLSAKHAHVTYHNSIASAAEAEAIRLRADMRASRTQLELF